MKLYEKHFFHKIERYYFSLKLSLVSIKDNWYEFDIF